MAIDVEINELINEGFIGLTQAIEKYNLNYRNSKYPDKEVYFSAYAPIWIRGKIKDFLRNRQEHITSQNLRKISALNKIINILSSLLNEYDFTSDNAEIILSKFKMPEFKVVDLKKRYPSTYQFLYSDYDVEWLKNNIFKFQYKCETALICCESIKYLIQPLTISIDDPENTIIINNMDKNTDLDIILKEIHKTVPDANHREPFILFYLEGLTYGEISRIYSVNIELIKGKISNARNRLRNNKSLLSMISDYLRYDNEL